MMKKIVIICSLFLGASVYGGECFDFDNVFLNEDKSEDSIVKDLSIFQRLLNEFFYIKGYEKGTVPTEISWETARELSRFFAKNDFDIKVREDVFNEERESFYSILVGGALVSGYLIGQYGSPAIKNMIEKFITRSRRMQLGIGLTGAGGFLFSSWKGGTLLPEGDCELFLVRSFLADTIAR